MPSHHSIYSKININNNNNNNNNKTTNTNTNIPIKPHPFLRQKHHTTYALLITIATILLSIASYAAWVTTAFSRRSYKHHRQHHHLCGGRSSSSLSLSSGRRIVSSTSAAFGVGVGVGEEKGGGRELGVTFFGRNRRTSASMMYLSNNNNNYADDGFASFLNSIPSMLSDSIQNIHDANSNDNNSQSPAIHVIMGNEAGDADSIISSLGLGYVQSLAFDTTKLTTTATTPAMQENNVPVIVPIVSVPRADMSLRRDVILLLDLAGINVDNLLYMDDDIVTSHLLPPPSSSSSSSSTAATIIPPGTTLTLVDHNRIRSSLSHLSPMVTEILDHHEDERSHEENATGEKRMIAFEDGRATVASTCTLVSEKLFDILDNDDHGNGNAPSMMDESLGLVLLGVILLDSVNMIPAAGKGTQRDDDAMTQLLQRTNWTSDKSSSSTTLLDTPTLEKIFPKNNGVPDRTSLFEVLSNAKNDPQFWASLSVTDCLRIDYKKFLVSSSKEGEGEERQQQPLLVSSIGLSSVLMDMDSLLAKDDFEEELTAFLNASDVGLFGIMAVEFRGGKPHRELLLTGSDVRVVDSFADYLLHHADAAFLEMSERKECIGEGDGDGEDDGSIIVRVFRQGNGKGSRKQVAPVLLGHASSASASGERNSSL